MKTDSSKEPTILAVESSCDETAVALLRGHSELLSSVVRSQIALHAPHGGVVPEIASRNHLLILPGLVREALRQSGLQIGDIDAFAATIGPGLAPALLVGLAHTKALAIATRKPFLPVNHLEAHLLSPFFGNESIPEHVGLVVSGGHTLLIHAQGFGKYHIMGGTRDDAVGEAFDKVGKLLGLAYPAGVEVDRLADAGNPERFDLPRAMLRPGNHEFSFSGLKTAVRYLLEGGAVRTEEDRADLCASFREAALEVLAVKLLSAAHSAGVKVVGVSGGVSANANLRRRVQILAEQEGIAAYFAPPALCTDNAAMIAYTAALHLASRAPRVEPWRDIDLDACPHWNAANAFFSR
jgi:N6-L-threonylcarbamoyladenine synthase